MRMDLSFTRNAKRTPGWKETAMNYHKAITLKNGRNGPKETEEAIARVEAFSRHFIKTYGKGSSAGTKALPGQKR